MPVTKFPKGLQVETTDMDMLDGGKVISDGILDTPTVLQCLYAQ